MSSVPHLLRQLLVCPQCRGELVDEAKALRCDACRLRYPVEHGTPVLLIEEAEQVDPAG